MRDINKGVKMHMADSKQQSATNNDCLPGGSINMIRNKCTSIIESKYAKIRRLVN